MLLLPPNTTASPKPSSTIVVLPMLGLNLFDHHCTESLFPSPLLPCLGSGRQSHTLHRTPKLEDESWDLEPIISTNSSVGVFIVPSSSVRPGCQMTSAVLVHDQQLISDDACVLVLGSLLSTCPRSLEPLLDL